MPRSSSSSSSSGSAPRILGRAMAILSLPLTPLSKARAARSLLLFKKRRARRLRHYNYAYVGEYQFSPSGSPLLPRPPGVSAWRAKRRSRARMVLAALLCGGGCGFGGLDGDGGIDVAVLDGLLPLPRALQEERAVDDGAPYGYGEEVCHGHEEEEEEDEEVEVEYEGDEEVDGRAERFIERFYEEMRMQQRRLL